MKKAHCWVHRDKVQNEKGNLWSVLFKKEEKLEEWEDQNKTTKFILKINLILFVSKFFVRIVEEGEGEWDNFISAFLLHVAAWAWE